MIAKTNAPRTWRFKSRYSTAPTSSAMEIERVRKVNAASAPPATYHHMRLPWPGRTPRSITAMVSNCAKVKTHSDITVEVARKTSAGLSVVATAMLAAR